MDKLYIVTLLDGKMLQVSLFRDRALELAGSQAEVNILDGPLFHGKECLGHSQRQHFPRLPFQSF